jgi:hypothetical protein
VAILALLLTIASIEFGSRASFSDVEVSIGNTFTVANEAITIVGVSGDGEWNSPTWVLTMYANEKKTSTVTFANSSAEDIPVTLTASPASHDDGNLAFGFDNPTFVVPAEGEADVVFWVKTNQSVTPGTYLTIVTVERESILGEEGQ